MVELTTPPPPIPKLGWLGPETVGSRGVVVACVEKDERDGHVGSLYAVETEDGSPRGGGRSSWSPGEDLHPDMPPRCRSDLPEGTRVRIRFESDTPGATTEAVGEITGIWWTTSLEPAKGYIVQVGESPMVVLPDPRRHRRNR